MNDIAKLNTAPTMSSLDLLEMLNAARVQFGEKEVRRNDFTARCKDELDGDHYETFVVPNSNGTESEALELTQDQCMLVLMRESKQVRRNVLEKLKAKNRPAELSRLEILQMALDSEQRAITMELERDEAIRTKAQIGSKREASAMGKASAAIREAEKLRDMLGANARHATVTAVQNATGLKYAWLPLRKWCEAHDVTPESVPDARYGEVKAWPAEAWGDVHAVSLQELFGKSA